MKILVTITPEELNQAVTVWLQSQGHTIPPSADLTVKIGKDPSIIEFPDGEGLSCIATCFGYDDPEDNGRGTWGANTNNTTLVGVGLPIPIIIGTLGSIHVSAVRGHQVKVKAGTGKIVTADIVDLGPGEEVNGRH